MMFNGKAICITKLNEYRYARFIFDKMQKHSNQKHKNDKE